MKTTSLWTVLAAVALIGATAGYGSGPATPKAVATVEFLNPENFTDFKLSSHGTESEQQQLAAELRKEINRLAAQHLPAGYRVMLRFDDVDLAGDFEPFRTGRWSDVRIMRSVYAPRLRFEYSVVDAAGTIVAAGKENRADIDYQTRLQVRPWSETRIENELLGDFFSDLSRKLS